MNVIIIFSALVGISFCNEQANLTSFVYTSEEGETWIEDLTVQPNLTYSPDEVLIYYYNRKNSKTSWVFKSNDTSHIKNCSFSASKPSVFLIHGWTNSHESNMCVTLKESLLEAFDVNVFVVDWNSIARKNYVTARYGVKAVGEYVAEFISLLEKNFKLNLANVKLVGHSLGAHVAGNAGAALRGRVGSIMGLDPAGPGFKTKVKADRLDKSDARFVEAIHTNSALLGINFNVGHADYWPNSGRGQPGCKLPTCSHGRAYQYYAESIRSNKFVARKCDDYKAFSAGKCNSSATASMGMYYEDRKANGTYQLTTNSASPFARG